MWLFQVFFHARYDMCCFNCSINWFYRDRNDFSVDRWYFSAHHPHSNALQFFGIHRQLSSHFSQMLMEYFSSDNFKALPTLILPWLLVFSNLLYEIWIFPAATLKCIKSNENRISQVNTLPVYFWNAQPLPGNFLKNYRFRWNSLTQT